MMTTTIAVVPKVFSPKVPKTKQAYTTSQALYGCEHLQQLAQNAVWKQTLQEYSLIQRAISDRPASLSQTCDSVRISLRPTYLCLQCPNIGTPEARRKHWETKRHAFSIECRSGCLFCQNCQDFVYDPSLEEIRLAKGSKRKRDEIDDVGSNELLACNSSSPPCRATGLRGLFNMGQTCFMGVILQSIIHNPFIRNFYLAEGHTASKCARENCVSCAIDKIFEEYYSVEKVEGYGAVAMLVSSWLDDQALAGYQQQDANEYMQFLLNSLHIANGGTPDDSSSCSCIIHTTFYGKLRSTVSCEKCHNTTTAIDPVMDLSLDLKTQVIKSKTEGKMNPAVIDLKDCLERFTSKENLASAEYTCLNCEGTQQNATKQLSIQKLPPVLCIHLKRFEHSKANASKLCTKVTFPLQLDMYPYTVRSQVQSASSAVTSSKHSQPRASASTASACMYDLSSVSVHKGTMESGHYVCYARKGNDWFLYDDSKVTLVSEAQVLDADAYLLFYVVRSLL